MKFKESALPFSSLIIPILTHFFFFFGQAESLANNIPLFFLLSIVSEAGASIYSVSPEANKEMPELDPNLRSAGKKLWTIKKRVILVFWT